MMCVCTCNLYSVPHLGLLSEKVVLFVFELFGTEVHGVLLSLLFALRHKTLMAIMYFLAKRCLSRKTVAYPSTP